jgi:hypothetical protein
MTTNFMGLEGWIWFQGVVEDRNDPLKLGRCRVRCVGFHTESKTDIPTDDLPWAMPMQPITSAAMNGIGQTPLGPVEGTWVIGFFRDGRELQEPVILGTLGGIPEDVSNPNMGFNDPNGVYPKTSYLNEPDTNRLARNENTLNTIVQTKKSSVRIRNEIANSSETWDEPETEYGAEYPKNHVYESESGHIKEVDDTPNKERLHTYHKSGTFEEIYPDGRIVRRIVTDEFEIIVHDKNVYVGGNVNLTIDHNVNLKTSKLNIETDDLDIKTGTYNLTITGDAHVRYDGDIHTHTGADTYVRNDIGTDFSCPTDPPRNVPLKRNGIDCTDVNTVGE